MVRSGDGHDDRPQRVTDVPLPFSEQQRRRRRVYLILMGVCLTLILLAWTWVRLWSTPLAVAMSFVASVIPPVAAVLANRGRTRP
jgi:Flp pilus assembly protein TadB